MGPIIFAQTDSATIGKAEAVLKNLQDGRYGEVVKEFNPVMEKAIPEERLRAVCSRPPSEADPEGSASRSSFAFIEIVRRSNGARRTRERFEFPTVHRC
jgi:hypothetical protein